MQQSYSMFRLSWTLTMQQWGCCTSCKTLQQKENRTQIFFQLMNKHIIYIQMFRKINNRLQNNVIFLFCHSASVIAVTVFLWTCEDNWSYFCCLHPEAGLYKRLSLWLLSQGRGEGRGNEKRKKKKKKKRADQRGEEVQWAQEKSAQSTAVQRRREPSLKCQRKRGERVRVRQFLLEVSYSDCLIRSWCEHSQFTF